MRAALKQRDYNQICCMALRTLNFAGHVRNHVRWSETVVCVPVFCLNCSWWSHDYLNDYRKLRARR